MINRLIEITGKNFDRQDLDDIQASQKAQFWREIALKYGRDDEDCKGLISDDEAFVGIDPSYIVPHSAAKLEELWSEVRSFSASTKQTFECLELIPGTLRILFAANSTFFICGTGFSFDLKL
ncbi:hypothetical protein PF003_g30615 [Phytophthora fragariae]|nr:hypothetical protein PF003_g30615 [Phytophthora fragariae]